MKKFIIILTKFVRNNWQLLFALATAGVTYSILLGELRYFRSYVPSLHRSTAYLIVWDVFLLSYLTVTAWIFSSVKREDMEKRAHREYEKKEKMLVLVLITSVVSIVTIVREMSIGADLVGWQAAFHVALTFITLVASWLFIHVLFALYYAHAYYDMNNNSIYPLDFPYEDNPDYWDFVYFSLGIGTTGQTADISFTSRKLRRVGTFHSVLSFFFNTAVLALMIEMSASLIS